MFKHVAVAAVMTCGALGAYSAHAQTAPKPPATAEVSTNAADIKKLIGRDIQNTQNETIGEIKSVFVGADGKVDSVMVGVGGFLGMGEKEVRLAWKDLKVQDGGNKVVVDMTKDQLKAMPEYKYRDAKMRGQVFTDQGPYGATSTDRSAAADRKATTTESTGDFNARGEISGDALIGAKVLNRNKDTIGEVEDVYIDKAGVIKELVVSVGGFLGMGEKNVAVKWTDIHYDRDGKSLTLTTDWTKDSLKAMPDYKYERRQEAKTR